MMLENQYVKLYLLQMQLLNNLQTEPYQLKSHDRSQTIDFCSIYKNDKQQIPIQQHFKLFLINQSQEMRRNPHSKKIEKFDRSVQHIKYIQRQQVSIQQFDKSGGVNAYNDCQKNKTERSYTKDKPQFLFNQFRQRIKRKKQSSKSLNTIQDQEVAKQRTKQKEIKSFGSFLENIKGNNVKSQTGSRRNQSVVEKQKNYEQELKVRGNLKQLRQKCIKSKLKQRASNKNSSKSVSVDEQKILTAESNTVASKKSEKKSITFAEKTKNQISPVKRSEMNTIQVQEPSPKSASRIMVGGYKNFYSPFNGIQIKYISCESQDIFQKLNASLDNKNQNLAITSFKKPFSRIAAKKTITPNNIQKGIVFRYKQPNSKQIQQSIQGWKVDPYYDLNNDLFVQ